jgi:hypothetical protein
MRPETIIFLVAVPGLPEPFHIVPATLGQSGAGQGAVSAVPGTVLQAGHGASRTP